MNSELLTIAPDTAWIKLLYDNTLSMMIRRVRQLFLIILQINKKMESINLQIFEFVIFSQDVNPSLISHNSIIILEEQHFVSC